MTRRWGSHDIVLIAAHDPWHEVGVHRSSEGSIGLTRRVGALHRQLQPIRRPLGR
jgi:hypothetical protein